MAGITPNGNSKATQFVDSLRNIQNQYNPAAREQLMDKNGTKQFPVTLGSIDRQDDKFKMRAAIVDKDGNVPGVGRAVATEEYFDYAKRKQDEQFWTNFQEWIIENSDLSTPESAAYFTGIFPFIKEKMFAEIEREARLQEMLAKIAATGPQTPEDWYLIYCIQQGIIKPTDKPIHQLNQATFTPGLFSVFKLAPTANSTPVVTYTNPLVGRTQFPGQAPNAVFGIGAQNALPSSDNNPPTLPQLTAYYQKLPLPFRAG